MTIAIIAICLTAIILASLAFANERIRESREFGPAEKRRLILANRVAWIDRMNSVGANIDERLHAATQVSKLDNMLYELADEEGFSVNGGQSPGSQ